MTKPSNEHIIPYNIITMLLYNFAASEYVYYLNKDNNKLIFPSVDCELEWTLNVHHERRDV